MSKFFDITEEEVFSAIQEYSLWGSRSPARTLPKTVIINARFCEGYGLFIAEGDTGLQGNCVPNKVRFTNTSHSVLQYFLSWLTEVFPGEKVRTTAIIGSLESSGNMLELPNMKIVRGAYNQKVKYRIAIDSKLHVLLLLSLDEYVVQKIKSDVSSAHGYVRGLFAGEGTVYNNKSKYVRIEMRGKQIIEQVSKVLHTSSIPHRMYERGDRPRMWCIYIGMRDGAVKKFRKHIGFGSHQERRAVLESI